MKLTKSLLVLAVVLGASYSQFAQAETLSQALKKCGQVQRSEERRVGTGGRSRWGRGG